GCRAGPVRSGLAAGPGRSGRSRIDAAREGSPDADHPPPHRRQATGHRTGPAGCLGVEELLGADAFDLTIELLLMDPGSVECRVLRSCSLGSWLLEDDSDAIAIAVFVDGEDRAGQTLVEGPPDAGDAVG